MSLPAARPAGDIYADRKRDEVVRTVRRKAARADSQQTPAWGRGVAAISLMLRLGVGVGGRAIGFY
jgi:hypothetical protein